MADHEHTMRVDLAASLQQVHRRDGVDDDFVVDRDAVGELVTVLEGPFVVAKDGDAARLRPRDTTVLDVSTRSRDRPALSLL